MNTKQDGRRRFLKTSAALGLTAGTIPVVKAQGANVYDNISEYGERSHYVTTQRISDEGSYCDFAGHCHTLTPLQDQLGIITPSPLHFFTAHGAYPPDINPDEHELLIHGMVDRPMKFSMAQLKRFPVISRIHFIECTANAPKERHKQLGHPDISVQRTHGKTACSEWTGVPLSALLNEVGVQSGAEWFVAEAINYDHHSKSLQLSEAENCFLAYGQNGEPLRPHQGFPLRLMVPGDGGFSHVKWLHRIKLVDKPYLTPSDRYRGKLGPKSVITFPSGSHKLTEHGFYTITGLAWSGAGAIRSVEVSTDGGKNWQVANLSGQPVLPMAHTFFSIGWNWDGKETTIMSRCTDEKGQVQPAMAAVAQSSGAEFDLFEYQNAGGQWDLIFPLESGE